MSQYQQGPQDPQFQPQQPPPGWQPPPPPKKKHTVRNVFIVLAVLAVVGIGGCVAVVGSIGNEIDKQTNAEHTAVYKVTGTVADLTYQTDAAGTTEQAQAVKLPWSKSITYKGTMLTYQVIAQNTAAGTVACSIEVDGKVVKTATASGQGAIAHCVYTP